jgi:hypothetical protein
MRRAMLAAGSAGRAFQPAPVRAAAARRRPAAPAVEAEAAEDGEARPSQPGAAEAVQLRPIPTGDDRLPLLSVATAVVLEPRATAD